MTKTWLPQTKRVADALRSAGYKRGEFKVRTPCNKRGEYQETEIVVYATTKAQDERLEKVLASGEIAVTRFDCIWNYGANIGEKYHNYYYHREYKLRGKLEIINLEEAIKESKETLAWLKAQGEQHEPGI
jgi:hypothetical protein